MSKSKRTFNKCPRCHERGLEVFETHSYCVNCNFSTEDTYWSHRKEEDVGIIPNWAKETLNAMGGRSTIEQMDRALRAIDPGRPIEKNTESEPSPEQAHSVDLAM